MLIPPQSLPHHESAVQDCQQAVPFESFSYAQHGINLDVGDGPGLDLERWNATWGGAVSDVGNWADNPFATERVVEVEEGITVVSG